MRIVTYTRLVTKRPVPAKGVALMGGICLCVKKVNEIVKNVNEISPDVSNGTIVHLYIVNVIESII